jgi:peptidoglycan/xylan/chitin deacetylase (PgdA/CDA1 family)
MRAIVKNAFYSCQRQAARLRLRWSSLDENSRTRFAIFSLHAIAGAASDMAVSEASLRAQLSGLLEAGYRCLDLPEALRALAGGDPLSQPAFCLTFDDGYRSVYDPGLQILEDLNLTATLFITVNFLDGLVRPPWHSTDAVLLREYSVYAADFQPLDWPQLREMVSGKRVRVGSHTLNHFMTGHLGEDDLRIEINQSKDLLEHRLGVEVPFFAYPYGVRPYGAYSLRSEAILREAGYQCSCTSRISRAAVGAGAWLLPRISLVGSDTALDARAKAAGAYDWVALAQNSFHGFFPNPHRPQ